MKLWDFIEQNCALRGWGNSELSFEAQINYQLIDGFKRGEFLLNSLEAERILKAFGLTADDPAISEMLCKSGIYDTVALSMVARSSANITWILRAIVDGSITDLDAIDLILALNQIKKQNKQAEQKTQTGEVLGETE